MSKVAKKNGFWAALAAALLFGAVCMSCPISSSSGSSNVSVRVKALLDSNPLGFEGIDYSHSSRRDEYSWQVDSPGTVSQNDDLLSVKTDDGYIWEANVSENRDVVELLKAGNIVVLSWKKPKETMVLLYAENTGKSAIAAINAPLPPLTEP